MKRSSAAPPIQAESALKIGRAIEAWRVTQSKSQRDLERIAKVSQSQVSRILTGKFSRASAPIVRLCSAAGVDWQQALRDEHGQAMRKRLHAELDKCWDGSRAGAEALIGLLRAAGQLRQLR